MKQGSRRTVIDAMIEALEAGWTPGPEYMESIREVLSMLVFHPEHGVLAATARIGIAADSRELRPEDLSETMADGDFHLTYWAGPGKLTLLLTRAVPKDEPVPGARVRLWLERTGKVPAPVLREWIGETDASGRAVLLTGDPLGPPAEDERYLFEVALPHAPGKKARSV